MNNFNICDEIGCGRHATVFKARKKRGIDYLAVKRSPKEYRAKITNDVEFMYGVRHQNILRFYDWYETGNHLYMILEYCTGGDLLTLLQQDGCLPESTVLCMATDMMDGLRFVHSHGFVHCDIKLDGYLFNEDGVLKMSDFGFMQDANACNVPGRDLGAAKPAPPPSAEGGKRKPNLFYMAPELFACEGSFSVQSDLWSLGCIMYELATGSPPFIADQLPELVRNRIIHPSIGTAPVLTLLAHILRLTKSSTTNTHLSRKTQASAPSS